MSSGKYAVPESYFQIVSPLGATPVVDSMTHEPQNTKQVTFKSTRKCPPQPAITPAQVILSRNSIIDYADKHIKSGKA